MAKKIKRTLAAICLFFPAWVFAASNFSFNIGISGGSGGGGWNPGMLYATGLPTGSIMGIIENIMFWLLGLLGLLGVIGFVISGILYLISAGDETMAERAKTAMKYSIIGIVVGLIGVVLIQAINLMLNAVSSF